MSVRSTAKAIIIDDNKILLNRCYDKFNGDYYSLPGGGQNKYESIYDAIIRECKEETGYNVIPVRFCGICEEICDNEDTRTNYSQYAHKLYHLYICNIENKIIDTPTSIDDMQVESQWIDIEKLNEIRILPVALGENIYRMIKDNLTLDLGSSHIPYNHG